MAKILIIDDDIETVKLLKTIVEGDNHTASTLHESRTAMHAIETLTPDLILLDIMMPDVSGIAVCKMIKSNPVTRHIKVMIVSALSDDGTKRDCTNAGADQFVAKPILPRILIKQVQDLLAR